MEGLQKASFRKMWLLENVINKFYNAKLGFKDFYNY